MEGMHGWTLVLTWEGQLSGSNTNVDERDASQAVTAGVAAGTLEVLDDRFVKRKADLHAS